MIFEIGDYAISRIPHGGGRPVGYKLTSDVQGPETLVDPLSNILVDSEGNHLVFGERDYAKPVLAYDGKLVSLKVVPADIEEEYSIAPRTHDGLLAAVTGHCAGWCKDFEAANIIRRWKCAVKIRKNISG